MSVVIQDLRYAFRSFSNSPSTTAVLIGILSLGIGANAAIFSVTDALLLRSLPYQDSQRVVFLWGNKRQMAMRQQRVSPADYQDFREQNQVFDQIGAIRRDSSVLTGSGAPERIETAAVSPSIFPMLGMKPVLGRAFAADEDEPQRNRVAVLSYGLWERRFARAPEILGQKIILDGGSYVVVGVAPREFRLPTSPSQLWIPYTADPNLLLPTNRALRVLLVLGHLKAGLSLEQAQSRLRSIANRLAGEYPDTNDGYSVDLVPLREQLVGDLRPTLWTLMAAVAAVLFIACLNAAHLFLARAASREREIAVRTALGANPVSLVQQLLTESMLLALIAGGVGLLFAYWGTWMLDKLGPATLLAAGQISVDWRVLVFTLTVSVLTGVAFGMAPALMCTRSNLNLVLRSGGRGGTASKARNRTREVLVVCEVAASTTLLIAAGLLIRSLDNLQQVNPGFRPDHVLTMQLSLPPSRYPGLRVALLYQQVLDGIKGLPGVKAAGISRFLPLSGNDGSANFLIEGQPRLGTADQPRAKFRAASGGYFKALGIPLIRGRFFDRRDGQKTTKVVIINEAAARRFWPNQDPIGKRILSGFDEDQWSTIIGVVGDVKHTSLASRANPETYYQYLQLPPEAMNFAEAPMAIVVRTSGDPARIAPAVRRQLRNLDPSLPIYDVHTMQDVVYGSLAQQRFRTFLITTFAVLALVLAALGLYGVVAYSVSQRTVEVGIRMALGAEPAGILRLIVLRSAGLAALGLALGVAGALGIGRAISGLLFGVSFADPFSIISVVVVILLVTILASWVPASRAASVNPVIALRAE